MNIELPELHDFFGAYFHQDWVVEHETAEEVINSFLLEAEPAEISSIRGDLEKLLSWEMNELDLRSYMLKELSCYYCSWIEWESSSAWLRNIMVKFDTALVS